jgi:hypothetical protein
MEMLVCYHCLRDAPTFFKSQPINTINNLLWFQISRVQRFANMEVNNKLCERPELSIPVFDPLFGAIVLRILNINAPLSTKLMEHLEHEY